MGASIRDRMDSHMVHGGLLPGGHSLPLGHPSRIVTPTKFKLRLYLREQSVRCQASDLLACSLPAHLSRAS
jgi:hypothetical protein